MLPSIPKVFKHGLTKYTDDDPVTPKTQKRTAASFLLSLQLGLCFVVQAQKEEEEELGGDALEKLLLPKAFSVLYLIIISADAIVHNLT